MKQKQNRLRRALHWIQLPDEIDPHLVTVRLLGNESLLIEQHRGILRYGAEQIRFFTEQGVLLVTGKTLAIDRLSETRALIRGEIRSISFEEKS
jgi:sporulation protein YqfC